MVTELPSVQMSLYSGNRLANYPTRTMLNQYQFLNTNHRLVAATLKLYLKSRRMVPSQPRLDVGKLKDERVAEEIVNRLSGNFGGSGCFEES